MLAWFGRLLCRHSYHKWILRRFKGGTLGLIYTERCCARCGQKEELWRHGQWVRSGERQLRWEWEAQDRAAAVEVDADRRPVNKD